MKTILAIAITFASLTSFAGTRVYYIVPAQLLIDGLKELQAKPNCSPSNYCEYQVSNLVCSHHVTDGYKCEGTDENTQKSLKLSSVEANLPTLKLEMALFSLGYKNRAIAQWTAASVIEKITCSSQATGENAICYVTEKELTK